MAMTQSSQLKEIGINAQDAWLGLTVVVHLRGWVA
jgi:hypothetical protein